MTATGKGHPRTLSSPAGLGTEQREQQGQASLRGQCRSLAAPSLKLALPWCASCPFPRSLLPSTRSHPTGPQLREATPHWGLCWPGPSPALPSVSSGQCMGAA